MMALQTFAAIIGPIRMAAHELGYAIAVHGSLRRDIDLVAIPWTKDAASKEALLSALCDRVGGIPEPDGWRPRPHGRFAHIVRVPGQNPQTYIDLSVMDVRQS